MRWPMLRATNRLNFIAVWGSTPLIASAGMLVPHAVERIGGLHTMLLVYENVAVLHGDLIAADADPVPDALKLLVLESRIEDPQKTPAIQLVGLGRGENWSALTQQFTEYNDGESKQRIQYLGTSRQSGSSSTTGTESHALGWDQSLHRLHNSRPHQQSESL